MVAACRLRRDVRGHCCGYRHADRDRSGEVGAERAPAVLGSGPLGSGSLIATILPDCRPTLNCRLDPRGWGSCCLYRLGFELRRSDLVIMAGSVGLLVLVALTF